MRSNGIRSVLVGTDRASAKTKLDQERHKQHREGNRNEQRHHAGPFAAAAHFQYRQQVEHRFTAEESDQNPDRKIAIMRALHRKCELGIDESEVGDGAEPIALERFGDEIDSEFGDDQNRDPDPKRLAADAAFKTAEKINPIHSARPSAYAQSRSSSLILVLARVFSSTRLTMTAQ